MAGLLLVLLALTALVLGVTRGGLRWRDGRGAVVAAVVAGLLFSAQGPTAAWRHVAVGAGRAQATYLGANDIERRQRDVRRDIVWEVDGLESTLALSVADSYAFLACLIGAPHGSKCVRFPSGKTGKNKSLQTGSASKRDTQLQFAADP